MSSDTALRSGLAAALVVIGSAGMASAQTLEERQQVLDSVVERWRVAEVLADRADSLRRARATIDTVISGRFTVFTDSAASTRLLDALVYGNELIDGRLGAIDRDLLNGTTIFVDFGTARDRWSHLVAEAQGDSGARRPVEFLRVPERWSAEGLGWRLYRAAEVVLGWRAGPTFTNAWAERQFGLTDDPGALHRQAYTELVTAPSRTVRLCFAGDIASCLTALAVQPVSDRMSAWYAEEDLWVVVQRFYPNGRRETAAIYARCVDGNRAEECGEYLRRAVGDGVRRPLTRRSTMSLMATAAELGGEGAYTRLVADSTATVADRLAAAAGVPVDSLVTAWRATVLAARPEPVEARAATAWSALMWIMVFAGLAIRSTRWR